MDPHRVLEPREQPLRPLLLESRGRCPPSSSGSVYQRRNSEHPFSHTSTWPAGSRDTPAQDDRGVSTHPHANNSSTAPASSAGAT